MDTNFWLEVLLDQQRADEARRFLTGVESRRLSISEFSLYSIGIILTNLDKDDVYKDFVRDVLVESKVSRVKLTPQGLQDILDARKRHGLDFDDAYQFVAAKRNHLQIISFDSDFDETPLERLTPAQGLDRVSRA